MSELGLERRRDLPHIDVEGVPYFVTACLAGSLPAKGLKRIRDYRDHLNERAKPADLSVPKWEQTKHKLVFKFVDDILDHQSPVTRLADDRLAQIVCEAFLHFAEVRYHLYAFAVMPSHHHWLFRPKADWVEQFERSRVHSQRMVTPRESISHSIQSFTAHQCNRLLNCTGAFWQTETFDHYVRDDGELSRIIQYIEKNPVVAGLAQMPAEYRWSSAYVRSQLHLQAGDPIPHLANPARLWAPPVA